MKKVTIEIPEGKNAEWVNGVLTLVDEKPKDITERVKTFEDAVKELGEEHPFVKEWKRMCDITPDLEAYLKLRIICAALNEGWEPQFTEDEWRWYPWFCLYTDEELSKKSEEWKTSHALKMLRPHHQSGYDHLTYTLSYNSSSYSKTNFGFRLCLKNEELAKYCGKQFIDIWADYLLK